MGSTGTLESRVLDWTVRCKPANQPSNQSNARLTSAQHLARADSAGWLQSNCALPAVWSYNEVTLPASAERLNSRPLGSRGWNLREGLGHILP